MNSRTLRHPALAVTILVLLAACGDRSVPARSASDEARSVPAEEHVHAKYRCPMHPEVVRDEPGTCPVCGMALVLVEPGPGVDSPAASTTSAAAGGDREVRISPAVVQNLGVRTEPVTRAVLARRVEAAGTVQFDERRIRQVRTRAEGWVEGLSVRAVGETVAQGQVLFTLYSPMLESAQQEYLDALEIGNADLVAASRERLHALGLGDTVAQLERSRRTGGRVPFRAPIAGVVTELEAREGAMLGPDMVALTITGTGSLWVIAQVPEAQAGWLVPGTRAHVQLPSLTGELVDGRVDYVYPELDAETRTLRARITLEAPPAGVRANMLAQVELVDERGDEVLNVPRGALIRGGGPDRVVVALGDGRFASREVRVGAESGNRVEIREGLREGELVVTAAQFLLDSEANLDAGLRRLEGEGRATTAPDPHAAHAGGGT